MGCNGSKAAGGGAGGPVLLSPHSVKTAAKEDNLDFTASMCFLSEVPLFKRLPKDQHPLVAAGLKSVAFSAGQEIITQGETGHEFFVIKEGEAAIHINGSQVATLKKGDTFGEAALLRDEPRTATVIALQDMVLLKLTREKFEELELQKKLHFAHRKAVGCIGSGHTLKIQPPSPKDEQERILIAKALRDNANLQIMLTLDDDHVNQLIDVAWKETVEAGKDIIKQGSVHADYFYLVQDGTFEIFVKDEEDSESQSQHVQTVEKGGSFGELALLYLVPRAATVTAKTDAVVWVIDRQNFKNILMKVSEERLAEYVKHVNNVELLAPLLAEEKRALAAAFTEMHYTQGDLILTQGEPGNTFYILYDGEVKVIKDGIEQITLSASLDRHNAQFFGERALMNDEPRAATVQVSSNNARALVLDRASFDIVLGPLEGLLKRSQEDKDKGGPLHLHQVALSMAANEKPREKVLRKDLKKIGLLGCGGFGAVELHEHKKSGESYAMKMLNKGYIVQMKMQESVMNEKNILLMTNSPFIIKLYECYNGSQTLYFLMEVALGGELFAVYNKKGFHGMEKHCMFYSAGTVCAFEHCHERHIIYRDLKPENLLINADGQVKLTDMGLAKFVIGKTFTTCGTPDYFAPEVIKSSGHTSAVDWWALGVLIFELMSGETPFTAPQPMQIYSKVLKGISAVKFPVKCQGNVGDLIKALLKVDPADRLPMRPGGVRNLEGHKWYSDLDWQKMKNLEAEPPYLPVVKSKNDIANFTAPNKEDLPKQVEYKAKDVANPDWDKNFAT